jgi:two-component system, LytTR family, response regulator
MQIKAVIIDDEKNAIVTLEAMLTAFFGHVVVAGKASNAIDGIKEIRRARPDILFLDVSMPGIDGLEMLELLESRDFKVIITSAHEKHALRAIKNKVDDFLVKPINIEELEKIITVLTSEKQITQNGKADWIKLVDKNETLFIKQDEIKYIRAEGRYSSVICENRKFLVTKNLGEFEAELSKSLFFRIHRSFIINSHFVKNISSHDGGFIVLHDGTEIEISRRRKVEFVEFMKR